MNKRVLFVIPYLYEGGAERALSNIEMNFPDDWEIETLINSEYKKAYPIKGRIHTLGINKKPKTGSVFFQFGVLIKRTAALWKLKKSGKYDACISMMDSANIANILSGNKKCRTIISVRVSLKASDKLPQYKYIINPLVRLMYNKADKVVAVSEELKSELIKQFGLKKNKVVSITNGYDLAKINELKKEPLEDSVQQFVKGKKVICNVGRLTYQKGQSHLIRAFNMVKEKEPESVLIIAGEGESKEYLEGIINELNLRDSVRLLGHTDNVYKYINASDIFAFPSLFEGFPNALAEAICVGTPCVVSDFKTGSREIIAPEILDSDEPVRKLTECEYGIMTPLCSGTKYQGKEPLEDQETELAKAIIRVLSDRTVSEKHKEKCDIRSKSLDIKDAVMKWIEVIE